MQYTKNCVWSNGLTSITTNHLSLELNNTDYSNLIELIGDTLQESRQQVARQVNTVLVQTYWEIGRYIVEFEQDGQAYAEFGTGLLTQLSKDLTVAYGKGFGRSNLFYMRKLYVAFPNSGTLSHYLSWSHYYEILKSDEPLEISFYIKQCEREKWSVRELKRTLFVMTQSFICVIFI